MSIWLFLDGVAERAEHGIQGHGDRPALVKLWSDRRAVRIPHPISITAAAPAGAELAKATTAAFIGKGGPGMPAIIEAVDNTDGDAADDDGTQLYDSLRAGSSSPG